MRRNYPEAGLQKTLVQWLNLARPNVLYFAVPNDTPTSPRSAARMVAMGVRGGVADLAFVLPDGRAAFLELKAGKNKQTSTQLDFEAEAKRNSALYAVARDFEEATGTIDGWYGWYGRATKQLAADGQPQRPA